MLCDAPAVPLIAAQRAGVPGFLTANFTWADIYAPYARALGGAATRLVADLRHAYRHATATFRTEPALRMSWLSPRIEVGMVVQGRRGRKQALRRLLGLESSHKLVYIYIGRYGQTDLDWARLGRLAGRGIHFVGYAPRPIGAPANLHVVPSADWPGGDLIASSDAIVAKAGYGTACEAMACRHADDLSAAPRVCRVPRRSTVRLRAWGGGVPVSTRDFRELALGDGALNERWRLDPARRRLPTDGAAASHAPQRSLTSALQARVRSLRP